MSEVKKIIFKTSLQPMKCLKVLIASEVFMLLILHSNHKNRKL
ncbi:uncharacterized protein METZ01_LOCUS31612 [marine metagenome]|uniref:Uncharacterized protein n=1 Tax=marine metagenome TaxID=408172 RepID=A0A381QII1_9ZZZZ